MIATDKEATMTADSHVSAGQRNSWQVLSQMQFDAHQAKHQNMHIIAEPMAAE